MSQQGWRDRIVKIPSVSASARDNGRHSGSGCSGGTGANSLWRRPRPRRARVGARGGSIRDRWNGFGAL